MNDRRINVGGQPVKLICSCVRNKSTLLAGEIILAPVNQAPKDGDLVLVKCLDSIGAYDHVENESWAPVKLYRGDVILVTLGTRRSGTNLIGEIPEMPMRKGDRLDLVAQGGIAAVCSSVPAYYGTRAMGLEIIAFPSSPAGKVLNLADAPLVEAQNEPVRRQEKPILFVCGTSAEVGKTTFVCNLNIALKSARPGIRTAAIKACGTGRAKDSLNYHAANYDVVRDFVDTGLPSTYGVSIPRFRSTLHTLIAHCSERADFVVVEIGGDFLEARAPEALQIMKDLNAECVMLVNDAMGAIEGMRQLKALEREPLLISTFKQNLHALAHRLGVPVENVVEPANTQALLRVAETLLSRYPSVVQEPVCTQ